MSDRRYSPEISSLSEQFPYATRIDAGTSMLSDDEHYYKYASMPKLPEINLPEKIIFVIDTFKEQNEQKYTPFKLGDGHFYTPLQMIKRAIEAFVCAKISIQRNHSFALVLLDCKGHPEWVCDFTSNLKHLSSYLENIVDDVEEEQKTCDLGRVFETITKVSMPKQQEPTFTIRVILIYSRSNCMPKLYSNGHKHLENLTENPYFFLDVLFVHEPNNEENSCDEIYNELSGLETALSYIFEVERNATILHDDMAKLLAHPLQRPLQKDAFYNICSPEDTHPE